MCRYSFEPWILCHLHSSRAVDSSGFVCWAWSRLAYSCGSGHVALASLCDIRSMMAKSLVPPCVRNEGFMVVAPIEGFVCMVD